MSKSQIHTGHFDHFSWLTSTDDYSGTILRACPDVVLGRHVAVTCVDGGKMRPTKLQLAAGWEVRRGIGYSPKLDRAEDVPHQLDGPDGSGYDEFYTFEDRCDLGERVQDNIFLERFAPAPERTAVFVSWADFVLHSPKSGVQQLLDLFWPQLQRLNPESYIADGYGCLTFVSRNKMPFEIVRDRLTMMA